MISLLWFLIFSVLFWLLFGLDREFGSVLVLAGFSSVLVLWVNVLSWVAVVSLEF